MKILARVIALFSLPMSLAAAQIPFGPPSSAQPLVRLAGIGDVDGDGSGDLIVWRPQTGAVTIEVVRP